MIRSIAFSTVGEVHSKPEHRISRAFKQCESKDLCISFVVIGLAVKGEASMLYIF